MRDRIVSEIRRLAKANGDQPPGVQSFARETGIRESDWRGVYWARWGDALIEAGFQPNQWQAKHDSEFVFRHFIDACRHYSHVPTFSELTLYGRGRSDFPSAKSFFVNLGGKTPFLQKLREWVTQNDGHSDILEMLGPESDGRAGAKATRTDEGLVYLIKSGAHYKIGRSDALERRVKEIRVALPEAATLVHTIRTDDPSGIEAYWHRRFSDRRANGEWFKLSNADVAAFRRRKFQ